MLLKISYVGHATLLIEIGGVRILTDPNFDPRLAGVLGRVAAPVPSLDAITRPNAILISHAHADHLSLASLRALGRETSVPLYAPPAVGTKLAAARLVERSDPERGKETAPSLRDDRVGSGAERREKKNSNNFRVQAVSPGDEVTCGAVTVHVGRAQHQGSRYGFDQWGGRGQSNTYLIDSGTESVFFAGDTGLSADSDSLVARILGATHRRLDVALLPIGYAPWWKPGFRRNHLSSADALTLFDRLDARMLIPYHWGTFHHLSSGPFNAVRQLEQALAAYPRRAEVKLLPPGATLAIDPPPG